MASAPLHVRIKGRTVMIEEFRRMEAHDQKQNPTLQERLRGTTATVGLSCNGLDGAAAMVTQLKEAVESTLDALDVTCPELAGEWDDGMCPGCSEYGGGIPQAYAEGLTVLAELESWEDPDPKPYQSGTRRTVPKEPSDTEGCCGCMPAELRGHLLIHTEELAGLRRKAERAEELERHLARLLGNLEMDAAIVRPNPFRDMVGRLVKTLERSYPATTGNARLLSPSNIAMRTAYRAAVDLLAKQPQDMPVSADTFALVERLVKVAGACTAYTGQHMELSGAYQAGLAWLKAERSKA